MRQYVKLFSEIINSTIWGADNEVRILWITMLAMKDRDHVVHSSVPGLATAARLEVEATLRALDVLKAPDEWSRSKEFEGRRVKEVDGGWLILNGEKYRQMMSNDERLEYQRKKQAEYRSARKSGMNIKSKGLNGEMEHVRAIMKGDGEAAERIQHRHTEAMMEKVAKGQSPDSMADLHKRQEDNREALALAEDQARLEQKRLDRIAQLAQQESEANSEAGPGES